MKGLGDLFVQRRLGRAAELRGNIASTAFSSPDTAFRA